MDESRGKFMHAPLTEGIRVRVLLWSLAIWAFRALSRIQLCAGFLPTLLWFSMLKAIPLARGLNAPDMTDMKRFYPCQWSLLTILAAIRGRTLF